MSEQMLDREYLWKDRMYPEGEKPEKMDIILKGKRGRLFCTYFMAGGAGPHPAVIICHGFPGNERNLDLAAALRRVGFHVMTFHYSGSWGSDGNFSLEHCMEDLESVFELVSGNPELRADPEKIFFWGHSMGGFVAYHVLVRQTNDYRSDRRLPLLEKKAAGAILAMPADFAALMHKAEGDEAFKQECKAFMCEGSEWLVGTSADLLYRESEAMGKDLMMSSLMGKVKDVPMLFINGLFDDMIPAELALDDIMAEAEKLGASAVERLDLPTDHMAADSRCRLTEETADWLICQCGQ